MAQNLNFTELGAKPHFFRKIQNFIKSKCDIGFFSKFNPKLFKKNYLALALKKMQQLEWLRFSTNWNRHKIPIHEYEGGLKILRPHIEIIFIFTQNYCYYILLSFSCKCVKLHDCAINGLEIAKIHNCGFWIAYFPDLALSNFHLFPNLKKHLGPTKFLERSSLHEGRAGDLFHRKWNVTTPA